VDVKIHVFFILITDLSEKIRFSDRFSSVINIGKEREEVPSQGFRLGIVVKRRNFPIGRNPVLVSGHIFPLQWFTYRSTCLFRDDESAVVIFMGSVCIWQSKGRRQR